MGQVWNGVVLVSFIAFMLSGWACDGQGKSIAQQRRWKTRENGHNGMNWQAGHGGRQLDEDE